QPPPPDGESPAEPAPDGEVPPEEQIPEDPEQEIEVIAGPNPWDRVISHVYSGIHFGLIIALAALGLSLVFGTMGLINFSHGELVTFGAFAVLVLNVTGLPLLGPDFTVHLLIAIPIALVLAVAFGYLQDRYFWGWLRRRGTGVIAM